MQQLAEGIYVETGYDGVNVGGVVTRRSIVCLDFPSYPRDARHWAMRLRQISPAPVQFLVLLDGSGDRVLNTRWVNARLVTQRSTGERISSFEKRYPQAMVESLVERNPQAGKELTSTPVQRCDFTFSVHMSLFRDGKEIRLYHAPGPDEGSAWAYLPETGILFTGDLVTNGAPPPLNAANFDAWLRSLQQMRDVLPDVRTVVPGRGEIGDAALIDAMITYVARFPALAREQVEAGTREAQANHVADLLNVFPNADVPLGWARQQVRLGLDRAFREWQASEEPAPEETELNVSE
jgi:glyoxylase-like metal-dependent hydrolase (beta-lactamase superfamily II)